MEKAPNITVHGGGGELPNNEHSAEAFGMRPLWRARATASQVPTAGTATTHRQRSQSPAPGLASLRRHSLVG